MRLNIINLKKMISDAEHFSFDALIQDIFAEFTSEEGFFWRDGRASVEGVIRNKGQTIEVSGVIKVELNSFCSLCLEEVLIKMDVPFSQEYQEEKDAGITKFQDELDHDLNYFVGDEIYLEPLIKEVLLLAQPLRQVCREDCRGLCPECGANLNVANCGCAEKKIDIRMAVLEKLLDKDKRS